MSQRRLTLLAIAATVAVTLSAMPAEADADGCDTGVITDFNGDGFADVVVGDPQATADALTTAGVIHVRYGESGSTGFGSTQVLRQQEGGDGRPVQAGARYGSSIATADVDCDGYTDILVGAPLYNEAGHTDAGVAQLLLGGASGAGDGGTTVYTAAQFGKTVVAGDQFGYAVDLLEDVGQGGTPAPDAYAMAIGVPYRDSSGLADSGALATRSAVDGGSTYKWIDQNTLTVPGASEVGDRFGSSVALGDLDGNDIDAMVGVPGENIGSTSDAGAVVALKGIYGDELNGALAYDQGSPGVPGAVEANDRFGEVIEITRSGSTTYGAIGIPGENVGSDTDAGSVQLFSGGSPVTWGIGMTQDTSGVGGAAESGDKFGSDVAIAKGSPVRLAVGVPTENTTVTDAGIVQLFRLDNIAADVTYSQGSAGVFGAVQSGDQFGSAVGFVDGASEDVLLIGVPNDVTHTAGLLTYVPYPSGTAHTWNPGTGVTFGGALASEGR